MAGGPELAAEEEVRETGSSRQIPDTTAGFVDGGDHTERVMWVFSRS